MLGSTLYPWLFGGFPRKWSKRPHSTRVTERNGNTDDSPQVGLMRQVKWSFKGLGCLVGFADLGFLGESGPTGWPTRHLMHVFSPIAWYSFA